MRFDRRHKSAIVGELYFYSSSLIDDVADIESDQNFDIFLADVEFVVGTQDFKFESGNSSSEFHPSVSCCDCVGDSL